jgi:hypothetical protein
VGGDGAEVRRRRRRYCDNGGGKRVSREADVRARVIIAEWDATSQSCNGVVARAGGNERSLLRPSPSQPPPSLTHSLSLSPSLPPSLSVPPVVSFASRGPDRGPSGVLASRGTRAWLRKPRRRFACSGG